jgi:hypothetical protein
MPEKDELTRQIDSFHKKGVDAFIIKPGREIGEKYLTDEYFELVETALHEAKRRYMHVVISDGATHPAGAHAEYVKSEPRIAARRLYAIHAGEQIGENEDVLFRVYAKLENGLLTDVALDKKDGYDEYNLVLGYAEGNDSDLLDPVYAESLIGNTYEKYGERFGEYFGQTVIGFLNEDAAYSFGGVTWTYDIAEQFLMEGGDFLSLTYMLIEPKSKKTKREAEFMLNKILRERLNEVYLKPLASWCSEHKVEYIFCADSNFGILKRDLEIAEFVVEVKKKNGYPHIFNNCFAKNSNDIVFEISQFQCFCQTEHGGLASAGRKKTEVYSCKHCYYYKADYSDYFLFVFRNKINQCSADHCYGNNCGNWRFGEYKPCKAQYSCHKIADAALCITAGKIDYHAAEHSQKSK